MQAVGVEFLYRAGETVRLRFTVTDENGDPANITGDDVIFVLARRAGADHVATTEGGTPTATATITDAPGGTYEVLVEADVTEGLNGMYRFESWLEDLSGGKSEPAHGYLMFRRSLRE